MCVGISPILSPSMSRIEIKNQNHDPQTYLPLTKTLCNYLTVHPLFHPVITRPRSHFTSPLFHVPRSHLGTPTKLPLLARKHEHPSDVLATGVWQLSWFS